ncbi:MAG: hypothetical protein R6U98_10945 [Pirellulaceae bacterium]
MKYLRAGIGLAAWSTMGILLFSGLRGFVLAPAADGHQAAHDLWEFAFAERRLVQLQLDGNWPLTVGDPIYRIDGPDNLEQVGEIRRIKWDNPSGPVPSPGPTAWALLYPQAPPVRDRSYMTYYTTPRSLTWVMETMLPPQSRARIAGEILGAYDACHVEVVEALKPVIVSGFLDAIELVEGDLAASLLRHREELERLASRYRNQVVEQELIPLVREEIWPIVQSRAKPLANDIGKEMFERASLWRFGWRVVYDKSFLPKKQLTQQEWKRFVREEGLPVLERHGGDIVAVQRKILEEISDNEKVRSGLERNLTRILEDPEFRSIVLRIFQEVITDNPRLHQRLEQHWNTAEAEDAMQLAAESVEPAVRRIGDLLFGTRQDGIAPEFAQVLRNQILDKDCRWLVIHTPSDSGPSEGDLTNGILRVRRGDDPQVNPFAVQLKGMRSWGN